jgi:hypothetical protein
VALAQLAEIYETLGFELNDAEQEVLRTILRKANW